MCTRAGLDPDQSIPGSVLPLSANPGSDPAAAQPRDQPGLVELVRRVVPVAGVLVDPDRAEQAELVVQPQRLRRQPGRAGELTDR
jgi:hypothetical protein